MTPMKNSQLLSLQPEFFRLLCAAIKELAVREEVLRFSGLQNQVSLYGRKRGVENF